MVLTRKKTKESKIAVDIDFSKQDKGYKDLLNPKLLKFVHKNIKKGNNLINTQHSKPLYIKKTTLYIKAFAVNKWELCPSWDEILCEEYNDFIKLTPCDIGKNTKLFVKLKSNENIGGFATYLIALQLGIIDLEKHVEFVKSLEKTFKSNGVIIHNLDVDWFHLKQFNKDLE